ncbi:MAG: hypothetical protein KGN32_04840 [Burkholderiales bacterium]|nr:hypothetical protein [Burkholderiales bacterium]
MKTRLLLAFVCFVPLALTTHAQSAIDFVANSGALPMRNLLLEVRQLRSSDRQRSALESSDAVGMGSDGHFSVQGQFQARNQQNQQSGTALQQVLVLNGRNANITLRTTQPLRVLQSFQRQGRLVVTQGVVFLEAGTGFVATPRWDGADQLELTIAAQQALPANSGSAGLPASASMHSVLMVPLGEWTTVAQSERSSTSEGQSPGGNRAASDQDSTEVQVRITVR